MAMAPKSVNSAAWITRPKAHPFDVQEAPYPIPGPTDLIIQNAAVAINPLEFKIQDYNPPIGGNTIAYPTILGADLAGKVVEVGSQAAGCKVGARVIGNASGAQRGDPAGSAFQLFTKIQAASTIAIPDEMAFEDAVVMPLACDTAMAGLFVPDQLGLSTALLGYEHCSRPGPNSVVLVWGGSSSVGCCAIQLAHAAGYTVFATASKRNHERCRSIGASEVFDYTDQEMEDRLAAALQGKQVVGAIDCIAEKTTIGSCVKILSTVGARSKVSCVLSPPQDAGVAEGIEVKRLSIPALRANTQLNEYLNTWMAAALRDGTLKPKPDAEVIGEGLEHIQAGVDRVREGVSATKIVVRLQHM